MRWEQIQGIVERLLLIGGTYAVARGWIGQAEMMQLVAAAIMIGGVVWGAWINRDKALVIAAANTPDTKVVTTKALAAATPNHENILSATEVKVVEK